MDDDVLWRTAQLMAGPLAGDGYVGCPIYKSTGARLGQMLIFDRDRGVYIRRGEQP